ncbi:hypothetical protein ASF74_15020 [Arthrobacter sp. Leaf145]|nr:hypothetical protein ASF74_15020 [Arthrobacter sp. Leaf145]
MKDNITRFWSRVIKTEDCWNWTGKPMSGGYGRILFNGKDSPAHRVAYELECGPIPAGLEIDHVCHNRICVRPSHLRAVTRKQNNENMSGPYAKSKSGVRGVRWEKGKWRVQVGHNGKVHHVGYFHDIKEAESAAIAKRNELFTHNDLDRAA